LHQWSAVNIITPTCQNTIPSDSHLSNSAPRAPGVSTKYTCNVTGPDADLCLQRIGTLLPPTSTAHSPMYVQRLDVERLNPCKPAQAPTRLASGSSHLFLHLCEELLEARTRPC
jgi:hypothetical protein